MELQRTREELARAEEKKSEKVRKKGRGRREQAVAVEILSRIQEKVAKPLTRDRKNRDLRMKNQEVTTEATGLEATQHAAPAGTHPLPLSIRILQPNCNR